MPPSSTDYSLPPPSIPSLVRLVHNAGAEFEGGQQPYCWKDRRGRLDVRGLLAMHIIHPNKISYSTAWNFALTLNPPGAHAGLASQTSNINVNNHGGGERGPSPFWCQV